MLSVVYLIFTAFFVIGVITIGILIIKLKRIYGKPINHRNAYIIGAIFISIGIFFLIICGIFLWPELLSFPL